MRRRGWPLRGAFCAACVLGCHADAPVVTLPAQPAHASVRPAAQLAPDPGEAPVVDGRIAWIPYTRERVALERRRGRPVLLNFSAAWCMACLRDEREILETRAVRDALVKANVAPVRVDVTNEDEERDTLLESFGASALPAYVVIAADGTHRVLPHPLTVESIVTVTSQRR